MARDWSANDWAGTPDAPSVQRRRALDTAVSTSALVSINGQNTPLQGRVPGAPHLTDRAIASITTSLSRSDEALQTILWGPVYEPATTPQTAGSKQGITEGKNPTCRLPVRRSYLSRLFLSSSVAALWARSSLRLCRALSDSASSKGTPYSCDTWSGTQTHMPQRLCGQAVLACDGTE